VTLSRRSFWRKLVRGAAYDRLLHLRGVKFSLTVPICRLTSFGLLADRLLLLRKVSFLLCINYSGYSGL
jgi:hypothetical protein